MRSYFKNTIYLVLIVLIMGMDISTVLAYSSGPPFRRTGSPSDNFKTCKDVNCHNTYPLNSGKAKFSILTSGKYALGEKLDITVSFENSNGVRHGFELSALDAKNNHVGKFSNVDGNTQTSSDGNYIAHTLKGCNQSGTASWNVKWTAPSSVVKDPVTFYAAGNEANGNHKHSNEYKHEDARSEDYIYTATLQVNGGVATPVVSTTPTPYTDCDIKSISVFPRVLTLKKRDNDEVIVTLVYPEGCLPEKGKTVTIKINRASKKRISILPRSAATDDEGVARFTITAKNKAGKARVTFRCENFRKSVNVNVIK